MTSGAERHGTPSARDRVWTEEAGRHVVDARGLRCPLPVIEAAKAAAAVPPGTILQVLSTDPASRHDLPAWARMRGYDLVSLEGDDTLIVACVRVAGDPT